ncbi:interferon-inducible GTPase-domain-containing protein [Pisolithus microcarpus]|nr:interferon-inducible GTPase-domain-containing protein [Pisolithus microcarpus]
MSAKEKIEKQWKEGIQPVVVPNLVEREIAKRRMQYQDGLFHFAVAGVAGSGKSSLINAFRGLRNKEAGSAATGVTETTHVFNRYPDPDPQQPVVWYDIPGANTLNIPDWQYFNAQGLYIFDCIIVLFDNRFTATDIAILNNSARFNVPAYIVRSKADQQIRNTMREMGYDSDDENSDPGLRDRLYREARQQFIEATRRDVRSNLERAKLPDRRVYIVSNNTLLSVIKEEVPRKAIDEVELRRDIINQALARRGIANNAPAEEARRAVAAKEEAESRLKKGIRPVVTPSLDELERAKERIQYREGFFHFAVTGVAGSGKSSLVNAFRGLRNKDAGAAATGVTETTLETAMYPDPSPNHQLLWFDIPGAGTLKVPDWQYFNEHGLYVFDCIIVLFDARFTLTDIAILSNARRFNIPAYIVRSKADQHIRNIMRDMGYNSDDDDEEDDPGRRNRFYKAARKQYIEETRKSIKANLENANLPDEQVYLVSNDTMLSCVTTQKPPKKVIDEIELLTDIYTQVVSRRSLHNHDALSSTVIPSMVSATSFASMLSLPTLSH